MPIKRISAILGVVILLTSCNPFISKDLRRKNKCNRKLERVVEKCPELLDSLTTTITVRDTIPPIEIKDTFYVNVDSNKVDSLVEELSKLETKEEKVRYLTRYVAETIFIDTSVVRDGVTVNILLQNGSLEISVDKPEEVREKEVEVVTPVVTPIKLNMFEQFMNFLGGMWWGIFWIIVVLAILYGLYRKFFK